MRLLLVEDDVMVASGIKLGLTDAGYAVDWVGSGERAEEVLKAETFDAAIIDIGLPRMDGLATFRALRAVAPSLPVIISSGYGADGRAQEVLDAGACAFLPKPWALEQLAAAISNALAARRRGRFHPPE